MKDVRCTLKKKTLRTGDVMTFRMVAEEPVDFLAGQFLQVIFDEENRKNKELNKFLSFSCAPGKEYFDFTKKIGGSVFCEQLKKMEKGDTVLIKLPMGRCVFDPAHKEILFLAGGIGITPVISIIEHIIETAIEANIALVYANRTAEDIAFKEELENWNRQNSNLRIIHVLEQGGQGNGINHIGFITADLIRDEIADYRERELYIFGPPAMVNAMKDVREELEYDKAHVHSESFMGY